MTRLQMSRWRTLFVVLVAMGCADMKAVLALAADLQKEYHVQAAVNISNATDLTITFPQAAIDEMELDSAEHRAFARRVAMFAKAHYVNAAELERIRVTSSQTSSSGPLTITRTQTPYSFEVRELTGP